MQRPPDQMLTIQDARGIVYLASQYDSSGRVVQQTEADGGVYQFKWTPTANTNQDHFSVALGGTGGGGFGGGVLIRDSGWAGDQTVSPALTPTARKATCRWWRRWM